MNRHFIEGFLKQANHMLAQESMGMDSTENEENSQAYLEASYDSEASGKPVATKKKKVVKEESTRPSNSMYLIERF